MGADSTVLGPLSVRVREPLTKAEAGRCRREGNRREPVILERKVHQQAQRVVGVNGQVQALLPYGIEIIYFIYCFIASAV